MDSKFSRRRFLAACGAAIVLAGGGWTFMKYRVWQKLAGKAHGMTGSEKRDDIRFVRQIIAQDNAAARTIMWQTEGALEAPSVEYRCVGEEETKRASAEADVFTDDGVTAVIYTAVLHDLPKGASMEYRITAKGVAGSWHSLHTDAGEGFKALIFPDSQSSDYTDWQNLAQDAAKRNPRADFFINMGDLVDNGEDHTQWEAWFSALSGIIDRIPVAPVMGNHETYDQAWKVREPVAYLHAFAVPENGSAVFSRYYYSFDYGPVHFIVLNTQEDETQAFHPGLVEEQTEWFRRDVAQTDRKWKIVLMHKEVLQYRIHNRPERREGISDDGRIWMPLFDKANIDVVFSAHLHTYRNRGHIRNFQHDPTGPLYILTGVAGNVRYPGLWIDHSLDETIAPQPETDNYLTLKADRDHLEIRSYLPDGSQIDEETVRK